MIVGYNYWGNQGHNVNYQQMPGYNPVDYSKGWNSNKHDQDLRHLIRTAYQQFDSKRSGQLDGPDFFNAYTHLCLQMGLAPPQTQQDVWNAVQQCDTNKDGKISQWEMFNLFKKIQGINAGMMMNPNSPF